MKTKAFTLIELLIVVAIIAILAAIAVPNFLEAQTRSKVSRSRADVRTLATAIEAYAVDYNTYPPDFVQTILVNPGVSQFVTAEGFVPPVISTPIAYLTNAWLTDPFVDAGLYGVTLVHPTQNTLYYQNVRASIQAARGDATPYRHNQNYEGALSVGAIASEKNRLFWGGDPDTANPNINTWEDVHGAWKIGSLGPNREYEGTRNIYDPSNGTISPGDIYRTQKRTEGGGL